MSRENIEVVRRAYEAWNAGDFDAAAELLDPGVEWRMHPSIPETGTYQGIDEVSRRLEDFMQSWEEFRVEVEELIDAGDRVVALTRFSGKSKGLGLELSGAAVDAQVWTFRDRRVIQVWMYSGTAEALEAVGLPDAPNR